MRNIPEIWFIILYFGVLWKFGMADGKKIWEGEGTAILKSKTKFSVSDFEKYTTFVFPEWLKIIKLYLITKIDAPAESNF